MNEHPKIDPNLPNELRKAIENYIRASFVGIFQFRPDDHPRPDNPYIGSGIAIEIANRFFLATAAHNFRDIPEGGQVALFSGCSANTMLELAHNYSEHGKQGTLDLAWIEFDVRTARSAQLTPIQLSSIDTYHSYGPGIYWATGLPAEMTKVIKDGVMIHFNFPLIPYLTAPVENQPATDDRILLQYSRDATTPVGPAQMPLPHGMSGGPVWYVRPNLDSLIWTLTDYRLVGIILQYDPTVSTNKHIVGSKMQYWLSFLLADHPELAAHIEPLLAQAAQLESQQNEGNS